jgi:hypothetical protein
MYIAFSKSGLSGCREARGVGKRELTYRCSQALAFEIAYCAYVTKGSIF